MTMNFRFRKGVNNLGYTHGIKWTDELIEKEILDVVKKLKLDHFPTHSEIIKATGNKSLAVKISRYKGTVFWAEKLNLPIKYSETSFGNKYEIMAINDIFEFTGLHSVQTSVRHPYDLLTDNSVKIDVKVSKEFTNNCGVRYFTFNLEKREPTCDIFILYCLNDDESIKKTLIIPACSLLGQTQVGVGENSKWDYYSEKWDFIKQYGAFFNNFKVVSF